MKLYYFSFLFFILLISENGKAQDTERTYRRVRQIKPLKVKIVADTIPVIKPVTIPKIIINRPLVPYVIESHWKAKNMVGFDLNEVAFVNWSAGGTSSISGIFKGNFTRIHTRENSEWVNELIFKYGINKQEGTSIRKTDDEFRLNSTYGYRSNPNSNWFYSVKFNFNTQFSNGYKYPDRTKAISKPFAPAYTFLGIGADLFIKKKKFDLFISPVTMKNTLVLDETLANNGAFGVTKAVYDEDGNMITPGSKSKTEIGFLITNYYKKDLYKNITMENRLNLYSDYINNFGNIDVEWKLNFEFVVNEYVRANLGTHLIYDDDIKTTEEVDGVEEKRGARVQLKQTLGIGLVYNF